MRLIVLSALLILVIGCSDPGSVPVPVYPNGAIYGPDGPKPMSGWQVTTREGILDRGDYYNTDGDWYIVLEDSAFLAAQATQVYLKRSPEEPERYNWFLYEAFRVSHRYIYLEDPMKGYAGFGYIIFIYTDYNGG